MLPPNEDIPQIQNEELWGLLFPACSCHVDKERSHFIRRTPGNNLVHAIVSTNETAAWVKACCGSEHIHIQNIDEDGLSYSVIWDATEWSLSDERRRILRAGHLASDISYLRKKAEALRIEMIADALSKAKLFNKQKAFEVAAAITSQGEEVYLNKSKQLNDALKGAFNNINCYFPIEEVLKIVDTRGVLESLNQQEESLNQQDHTQQNEQEPTEQNHQGSNTTQEQSGESHAAECPLQGEA